MLEIFGRKQFIHHEFRVLYFKNNTFFMWMINLFCFARKLEDVGSY